MKKVKQFVEDFVKTEASLLTLKNRTDLSAYNEYLNKYNCFFVERLRGAMGHIECKLDSKREVSCSRDEVLDDSKPRNPRHFFKLSQYQNDKYGHIWVAYVSEQNPSLKFKNLMIAFFIVEEDERLFVVKQYSYSKINKNGSISKWNGHQGDKNLTFDSLKGPVKIERYLEPDDSFDSLLHYYGEI